MWSMCLSVQWKQVSGGEDGRAQVGRGGRDGWSLHRLFPLNLEASASAGMCEDECRGIGDRDVGDKCRAHQGGVTERGRESK